MISLINQIHNSTVQSDLAKTIFLFNKLSEDISTLEKLETPDLFYFIEYCFIDSFAKYLSSNDSYDYKFNDNIIEKMIWLLSTRFNQNKKDYIDALEKNPHPTMINYFAFMQKENGVVSCIPEKYEIYILLNYLPNFYSKRNNYHCENRIVLEKYSVTFSDAIKVEENINSLLIKVLPDLINLNPAIAEKIQLPINRWYYTNPNLTLIVFDALMNSDKTFSYQQKLVYLIKYNQNKPGTFYIEDIELVNYYGAMSIKHVNDSQHHKKALVIYGEDHNNSFSDSETEFKLLENDYDVLKIDARNHTVSLEFIINSINIYGFRDLDEVYLNMHGGEHLFVTDTDLSLNKLNLNKHSAPQAITANSLIKIISDTTFNRPLKIVVYSCNGQLLTHKVSSILSKGSEIITLAENQILEDIHIQLNKGCGFDFKYLKDTDDIRKIAAKSTFYHNSGLNKDIASFTYGKIEYCNFRTPVNLSKKDIQELLNNTSPMEVVKKVSAYLSDNEDEGTDIINYTLKLFDLVNSTNSNYPLIEYRDNKHDDFSKYLGVASAIYGIYDQCGEGVISDSDFVPNRDNGFLEKIVYEGWQAAFNYALSGLIE